MDQRARNKQTESSPENSAAVNPAETNRADNATAASSNGSSRTTATAAPSGSKTPPRVASNKKRASTKSARKEGAPASNRQQNSRSKPSQETGKPKILEEVPEHPVSVRQQLMVFSISLGVHLVVFLLLGFIMLPAEYKAPVLGILSPPPEPPKKKKLEKIEIKEFEEVEDREQKAQVRNLVETKKKKRFEIDTSKIKPPSADIPETDGETPSANAPNKGEFSGRSEAGRKALLTKYGGTKASEGSVQRGLEWLARHQNYDGSWSFDHTHIRNCDCKQPGSLKKSNMGATAMALLGYLGHGDTHATGDYQKHVTAGLEYLLKHEKRDKRTGQPLGDFRGNAEGNSGMYIQGLVGIVLSEAYAMSQYQLRRLNSRDGTTSRSKVRQQRRRQLKVVRQLGAAAKRSIYFIQQAQHNEGGWRYKPNQAGDTSVTGWQVMALASAHSAEIPIQPTTIRGVSAFLDSVQSREGARYGYTGSNNTRPAMTAVGLLSRIYLGWKRSHPGLRDGVQYLSKQGPSKNNMYYNYYATQVMHQYGGPMWPKWNEVMRDWLVETQIRKGHARGSWNITDPHGKKGGRLYQTCLSIMTLEVYYRHLPLYHQRDIDKDSKTDPDGVAKRATDKEKQSGRNSADSQPMK